MHLDHDHISGGAHEHTHTHADGTVHTHPHTHEGDHDHSHDCAHDCGSCGSPNCRSFAEDVVKGEVSSNECIVMMRALLWHLAEKKFKGEEPLGEDTETGGKT